MLELRLLHTSTGVFTTANRASLEEARTFLKPQTVYSVTLTQPSSNKQSALLHVACQLAFDNQRAGPEVASWRNLKSLVLCMVGHCTEYRFPQGSMSVEVAHVIRQGADMPIITQSRTGEIVMRAANTTRGMSMEDYSELLDKVLAKLSEVFVPGMDIEDLKREIGADKHERGGKAETAERKGARRTDGRHSKDAPQRSASPRSVGRGASPASKGAKVSNGSRKKPAAAHAGHAARGKSARVAGARTKATATAKNRSTK